jgi:alkaline phosphatase
MMKKIYTEGFIVLFFLVTTGCDFQNKSDNGISIGNTKNIILFIGDGMGVAQVYADMTKADHETSFEKFTYSGFSKTYSADNYITDSGAGGTAIACGIKTKNGMIGVNPDSIPVSSIMEIAHKRGIATGVISTSSVTHATPASFVAHNIYRENYEDIANDFLKGSVDLFIGGGENYFRSRKDGRDLTVNLTEMGYSVVYNLDDLKKVESLKIAGLLAKDHMQKESEGRGNALTVMTKKAIETLSKNPKGFVLMVEGSLIDKGGHENDLSYIISEVNDLDNAIASALEYASSNNNTLVVVTADHETGGLSLIKGSLINHEVDGKFSTEEHTSTMVPIFSYGPGAERFSGIHENTFFLNQFLNVLGIDK